MDDGGADWWQIQQQLEQQEFLEFLKGKNHESRNIDPRGIGNGEEREPAQS
jgi:hypothetical protein